jgi:ADP-dependent NAD(P)H-hydrate dehydratase / NAD(P)H-hydrate epimerase
MLPILTPGESGRLDDAASERGTSVDELMDRAGTALARAARTIAGGAYGRRAVVVCGKGNNGGDGLVAARQLDRWGMGVTAVLMTDPDALGAPAGRSFQSFVGRGGRWRPYSRPSLEREVGRADVVVDAIFGTGFSGPPRDAYAEAIPVVNAAGAPVVAADIPSGVEGETGLVRGEAIRADLTVAFGALKPGLVFFPGADLAGAVEVVDIGFPPDLVTSDLWLMQREDVAALIDPRDPETHKRRAVVLVLAGSRAMTGAAVLTAASAYRAGAGLVTLAVPEGILQVVERSVTEATFLPLPETEAGTASEDAWALIEERLGQVHAVAVGPGLGADPSTVELVRRLVAGSPAPLVLDADGLNAFAGRGSLLADRASDAVLTPHPGEFGRLAGISAAEVLEDRVGHARKAAAEFRCPVLLKGSRTVVAQPDGQARVNPTGGSFLATAGTGDVLTGVIAALMARGVAPADAAVAGAYVHGDAGRVAAAELGDGTVASDVLARLPEAMARLRRGEPEW